MLIAGTDSNNYEVYVLYRRGKAGQDKVGNKRGHQGWTHLAQDILAATVITFFFLAAHRHVAMEPTHAIAT